MRRKLVADGKVLSVWEEQRERGDRVLVVDVGGGGGKRSSEG